MCLESILTDSIDIDYGSVLSSQRKQDIIAGIDLSFYLFIDQSIHQSIHSSIYQPIPSHLSIHLSIHASIYPFPSIQIPIPSIHLSIYRPGITSSQEALFSTSFQFLQHLTSEINTYTADLHSLRYVPLYCSNVRTPVLLYCTYSCTVLLYVLLYCSTVRTSTLH